MGISIIASTYKSPDPLPCKTGIPFPFNLNLFPFCVPDDIDILIFPPSGEGTSIVPPKVAVFKSTGALKNKFSESLLKIESSCI